MTIVHDGYVYRWAAGSFIAAWRADRADEHVPDDMIELPQSLNRSRATRYDISRIVAAHPRKDARE
jgi:hypothetical protein